MADPESSGASSSVDPDPGPTAAFDVDEEPADEAEPEEPDADRGRRTLWAVLAALAVGLGTILLARSIIEGAGTEVGLVETALVGAIAVAIALAAFLPYRWGYWVVPFVALAHYGLNFYNMALNQDSVYQFVEASAMGYAVLTPAIGLVLGWVVEGVYQVVAPT